MISNCPIIFRHFPALVSQLAQISHKTKYIFRQQIATNELVLTHRVFQGGVT